MSIFLLLNYITCSLQEIQLNYIDSVITTVVIRTVITIVTVIVNTTFRNHKIFMGWLTVTRKYLNFFLVQLS